jgi:hypothetical protein
VLPLESSPGELAGLVDELTVLLPWGSLLRAVARPDPARVAGLLATLRRGSGIFRFVFGYGAADAPGADLPPLDDVGSLEALAWRYRATVCATANLCALDGEGVLALRTTWSGKLAFSGHARRFVAITGIMR